MLNLGKMLDLYLRATRKLGEWFKFIVATYLDFNSDELNTLLVFENVFEKVFLLNALIKDSLPKGAYLVNRLLRILNHLYFQLSNSNSIFVSPKLVGEYSLRND